MEDLIIRPYDPNDKKNVINLWSKCKLVVPQNNPEKDIERKLKVNPEWFLVGVSEGKLVATCMVGYDGHRGWINYLAVDPDHQQIGIGRQMMGKAENILKTAGCPKINLQVRETNTEVIQFYKSIGYQIESVVNMGKRLEYDEPKQIKNCKK